MKQVFEKFPLLSATVILVAMACMSLSFMHDCSTYESHKLRTDKNLSSGMQQADTRPHLIQKEWTGCDKINPNDKPLCIYF